MAARHGTSAAQATRRPPACGTTLLSSSTCAGVIKAIHHQASLGGWNRCNHSFLPSAAAAHRISPLQRHASLKHLWMPGC